MMNWWVWQSSVSVLKCISYTGKFCLIWKIFIDIVPNEINSSSKQEQNPFYLHYQEKLAKWM